MEPILRISLGLALLTYVACQGGPRRPPNYSQSNMPVTAFSCRDKIIGGYYADPDTDCQMFHVCVKVPGLGVQDYKFLCPNDTAFDQENQICDDWFNIDCDASTLYYSDNFDLYRIGSDFGGGRKVAEGPKLPNININNAVSDTQDDDYLQRSDRGESVGSDLLRGSHSGNFFSNRNRGKEDDEDKEDYKKKKPTAPNKNNGVRKLLTGKRLIQSSTTQAPVVSAVSQYSTQAPPQRPNYAGRNRGSSNFNRNYNQLQSTAAPSTTQTPSRATETYSQRSNFNSQRTFYTQTTPKVEVSTAAVVASSPRNDYYRGNNYNFNNNNNYNYQQQSTVVPQANFYENTQNYNAQSNFNAQTNYKAPTNYNAQPNYNNYQQPSVAPVVNTAAPSPSSTINPNYETQKLYRLNTAAFNTAPEAKYDEVNNGEVLKTASSQNLGASNFNRVQNAYKTFNASVSTNYNFYTPTTIRPSTYYSPTTSTAKPEFFTNTAVPTTTRFPQQNYYSTTTPPYTTTQPTTTTQKQSPQYNYYTQPTQNYFAQTTLNTQQAQQDFYKQTTVKAVSNYQPPATFKQQYFSTSTPRYQQINRGTPLPQSALNQYVSTTDVTEKPRPFTTVAPFAQANKSNSNINDKSTTATKDKDQYDYAYYDDSPHIEYESLDNVEFSKTKSG